ncbi:heptahelical transmembrane protein 2-like [Tripterygium wilfordii]|uniref:heptahelical transmembrane protein 2-like n=1 Tax=Tripterygium wilfordii TaxID=458696 RepID=UPI0018F7F565|nr:heptahelical transmembrane protein 2-like [Tripterygium wilfordii]XP_038700521.1 heptahelical transmembrane protein 2-like [Tripterygium wilfordii]XP_038700522.1 heptahelical transmembrane protein 2-like [Tripterygium wilfordii]XP_038700523.1 heptahelical transmembrane protein 2-like [Tripterygium wilfordii]
MKGHQQYCNHNKSEEKVKKQKRRLMKYGDLPEYLKDNEYILDYYRCEWPLKDAFLSIFSWHNETLNVWTHLVGFSIFAALTVMSLTEDGGGLISNFSRKQVSSLMMTTTTMKNDTNVSDHHDVFPDSHLRLQLAVLHVHEDGSDGGIARWPWFVFLGGAMGCLICSSLSHLFACHSKRFNLFFWRLDYAGISLMIVSSFFAPIYYAFSCHPNTRLFYLTSISVLGVLAIIALLVPALSAPSFRGFRASLFLSMGFSGVIPASHAVALHWGHLHIFVSLGYELAMAIFYAVGAVFYVSRIPERWKPGAFDIAGHSHQIFHVFVVLGALAHSAATLVILDFRQGSPACVC